MEISYWRQLDVFNPAENNMNISVIGAGALGSWIILGLAKSGIKNITVYDFDKVEEHNLPNQVYSISDIGKLKIDALQERIMKDCGIKIETICDKVTKNTKITSGIVYLCTDTMSSRKEIWENCIKYNLNIPLMIETRLGAEMGLIYTINPIDPFNIEGYEKTLYTDEESEESPCTYRSIITVVLIMAGMAVHKTIKYINGLEYKPKIEIKEGGKNENVGAMCIKPLLVTSGNFK